MSAKESLPHQILNIDSSKAPEPTTRETPRKAPKSMLLLVLLS
jgi:hypothetical protein